MARLHTIVAVVLASGSFAIMATAWGSRTALQPRESQPTAKPAAREQAGRTLSPNALTAGNAPEIIRLVVEAATSGWKAEGLADDRLKTLRSASTQFLTALACANFEAYRAAMQERGGKLGSGAAEVIKAELATERFDAATKKLIGGMKLDEQFRYLWERPDLRNARWKWLEAPKAASGLGWSISLERKAERAAFYPACTSIMTVYDPPGMELISRALAKESNIAWVQFPVEFNTGEMAVIRLSFVFDEEKSVWYPARIDYPSELEAKTQPLFLL